MVCYESPSRGIVRVLRRGVTTDGKVLRDREPADRSYADRESAEGEKAARSATDGEDADGETAKADAPYSNATDRQQRTEGDVTDSDPAAGDTTPIGAIYDAAGSEVEQRKAEECDG